MSFERLKNRQLMNLASGLLCQVIMALTGLILPSMIIRTYGSILNGLISTITQMMAYLSLAETGLASAALVSLFKPMAEKDYLSASSIMSAINIFYIRVAYIFLSGSVVCGIGATFMIKDDIPLTTIWLVTFAVSGSSFISFRLLNKYKVLLQADNRIYIVNTVHAIGVIVQLVFSMLLIKNKVNIASTRVIIIGTNIIEWMILHSYSKRKFPTIMLKSTPQKNAIKQRKDIIVHQILSLVLNNTDVLLLATFSTGLSAVSVYTVYAMIGTLIHNALNSFISMFSSKMGQRYAIGDYEGVKVILRKYEVIYDIALFSLYSCMGILILPFISVYTKGISDVNYYDPTVGLLFSVYGITRMLRLPYSELTNCAGHFKETKIQAILEVLINLVVSIILIPFMGISGGLIGSIAGEIYRTIHTYYYCHKRILDIDWNRSIVLTVINSTSFFILLILFLEIRFRILDSYISFFSVGIVISIITFALISLVNFCTVKIYYTIKR